MQTILNSPDPDLVGQYLTRVVSYRSLLNIDPTDWETLQSGPDHDEYFMAWQNVLESALTRLPGGKLAYLYQRGCELALVPVEQ